MRNISAFSTSARITASVSFPGGFTVTEFPHDANGIEIEGLDIADSGMGPNGDLVTWSKPQPVKVTINVIPDSPSDIKLQLIFDSNRVSKNKASVGDIIDAAVVQPDGGVRNYRSGIMQHGMPGNGFDAEGRKLTKSYVLIFES